MEEHGQESQLGFKEITSYEWNTLVPSRLSNPWVSSSYFSLLKCQVCFFLSIDQAGTVTVQLTSDENLRKVTFSYRFEMFQKIGDDIETLFDLKGRHSGNSIIELHSFHESEIAHIKVKSKQKQEPVTVKITISDYQLISTEDRCIQTPTYFNEGFYPGTISHDFECVLERCEDPDLSVKCMTEETKGHRFVFQSRSGVFKDEILNDNVLILKDMSPSSFKDFVYYIYTDKLPSLNYEQAKEFYEIADYYDLKDLRLRCGDYLAENLSKMEACNFLILADECQDENLKEHVIQYILTSKVYLNDEVWLPFCEKKPQIAVTILNAARKMPIIEELEMEEDEEE